MPFEFPSGQPITGQPPADAHPDTPPPPNPTAAGSGWGVLGVLAVLGVAGVLVGPRLLSGISSATLPAGFPQLPAAVYSIQVCATSISCVAVPGTYDDVSQLARALESLQNTGAGLCGQVTGADSCNTSYTDCADGCKAAGDYFEVHTDFSVGCAPGPCQTGHLEFRVTRTS